MRKAAENGGFSDKDGSPSWIRTNDQVINSHLLYR
jgi:hypothetical protein